MTTLISRRWLAAGAFALLAPLVAISTAAAQSPTPEGTVITNTATATFTDANNNVYTPVDASVDVTVGFLAGPDVSSAPTVTPASPSTGQTIAFTITNSGNGIDQFTVSASAGTGVTITGYSFGGTTYSTLALLNAAIGVADVAAGDDEVVTVIYTVAPGRGGMTSPVSLTATSVRTPAESDASTTNVRPNLDARVSVSTADATVNRLPSNLTQYSQIFAVANGGNASDSYSINVTASGAAVTIISVNGVAGSTGSTSVAAAGSANVTVVYEVADAAAGTTDPITLSATSGNDATISDDATTTVRVIKAALTMVKAAFRDNQTTAITASDRVLPGEFLWYRIEITNAGEAAASTVSIADPLPASLTFLSSASDAAGWTISENAGTVTATLSGTLAPTAIRFFWIRAQVK